MKYKTIGVLFLLVASSIIMPFAFARAQVPFGGSIIKITTCNEGLLIDLALPSSIPILVPYGITYAFNVFRTGGWVLGLSVGASTCTVGNTVQGVGLRVLQSTPIFIGTSL